MTEQSNFEVAAVLAANVDTIVGGFGQLTDEQLTALAEGETAAGKRSTLLAAIETEQGARDQTAKQKQIRELAADAGVTVYFENDLAALQAETSADFEKRIQSLEGKLQKSKAGAAKSTAAKPRKLELVAGKATMPCVVVVFTGEDDVTIADLPELTFTQADFDLQRSTMSIVLKQPIEFPESARRTEVSKAWLLGANGEPAAVAPFMAPVPVGGGTTAKVPSGFLSFRPDAASVVD